MIWVSIEHLREVLKNINVYLYRHSNSGP